MATVPVLNNFRSSVGGSDAMFRAPSGPTADAVAGDQIQRAGQAVQSGGGQLARIQLDATNQANQMRVLDSMTQTKQFALQLKYDKTAGFMNLRGREAVERPDGKSLEQEVSEKLDEHTRAIEASLGNDEQKRIYREQVQQLRTGLQGETMSHMAREYSVYQGSVLQGTQATAIDQMGLEWGNADAVKQGRETIKAAVFEQGRLAGWSPQQTEAVMREQLSKGHSLVVAAATDGGKLDYAREYFKQHGDEFTPEAKLRVQKVLDAGDFESRTQDATDKLIAETGGDAAAALRLARERHTGKDEDAIVQRIKAIDGERVALRERAQRDASDQAWKIYASTGSMGRIPPTLIAAMDGKDLEALRRTAKADGEAAASKREAKTDPGVYYALTVAAAKDPAFKGENLTRYFDKLSPSDRKHFIDLQAKMLKPEEASDVSSVEQQKSASVKALGLKDEKAGVFYQVADKELFAAQARKGSKLTQEERQKVLDRLAMQGSVPGSMWGSNSARRFEAVNEGRDFTPEVTDDVRRKAEAALKRRGIQAPTKDQIEQTAKAALGVK